MVTFTPRIGRYRIIAQHRKLVLANTYTRARARTHTGIRKLVVRFHPDPTTPFKPSAPNRPHFVRRPRGEKEARGVGADAGAVEGRQATLLTLWPPGVNVGWLAASKWGYGRVGG